jgi:prepilin-type N-terminal cleavage/methylation domain-containing protein
MRHKKGFTLIELLVVIAIIGLLATIAIISLNSARRNSRDTRRISDMKQLQTAMEMYFNDKGNTYNIGCSVNTAVSSCSGLAGYLADYSNFKDPGANAYTHITSGTTSFTFRFTIEGSPSELPSGCRQNSCYLKETGFTPQ